MFGRCTSRGLWLWCPAANEEDSEDAAKAFFDLVKNGQTAAAYQSAAFSLQGPAVGRILRMLH